jgi:alpha-beta hydrolase superfamily lysophospholipase
VPRISLVVVVTIMTGLVVPVRGDYPLSVPVPPGRPAPLYQRYQVAARDGLRLVVHDCAPVKRQADQPIVLFLHGIGMHAVPYAAIAAGFTTQGIVLVAPDLRGHGLSEGTRGVLAPPHVLRADVGAVYESIEKRYPGAPVVLIGDSMGGLLAADYAWRGERRLAGLALLVPAFGVADGLLEKNLFSLGEMLTSRRVPLGTPDQIHSCTRNPAFARARLADPLALNEVSLSYVMNIARMQRDWPAAAAEVNFPLYVVVAGKDRVVDNKATRKVYDRTATPAPEKIWRSYQDASHTVCWDPDTPAIIGDLARWVLQKARRER